MKTQLQELTDACREMFPGLENHARGARMILRDIRAGRSVTIMRHDGACFDLSNREHVRQLAAALPSIAPHHSPAEHDRAAERIAQDIRTPQEQAQ